MKALLVWPVFPETFWTYDELLKLAGRKAMLPPLGLITVAAILPQDWEFHLVDRNTTSLTEEHWRWADVIMISGMIVQKPDMLHLVREAKKRNTPVVVGGPYVTSVPDDVIAAGADYLVLDEGEITIPAFVEHIAREGLESLPRGAQPFLFRAAGQKPDVTITPAPRFDLLDMDVYDGMSVQYSRGCPFLCEFCDIITLYGRKPRAKSPQQLIAEIQQLYDMGRRGWIFLVDDNFIGNKRNVKKLLVELRDWQREHGYPFTFDTEASIDLAADPELIRLMVDCRFTSVFVGIETPDAASLALTRKHQNTRSPMLDSIRTLIRSGLRVQCGLIIGFDGEETGAGERIVQFVEAANVPTAFFSILQALPNTALWDRLKREGRLLHGSVAMNQTSTLNFVPTRPESEIVREYVDAFRKLYEPRAYLDRTYRFFLELGVESPCSEEPQTASVQRARKRHSLRTILRFARALLIVCWRQGGVRDTRLIFWRYARNIYRLRPHLLDPYLVMCAHNEHFLVYRDRIRLAHATEARATLESVAA